MQSIVTLTMNPAIDKSVAVDHVVAERKLRCTPPRYDPGGGGLNVSRAIRKLGGESLALYVAGGDSGRQLSALLEAEGLRHRPIPIASPTREDLHVYEEATGQQFRFNMPGSAVAEPEWEAVLDGLRHLPEAPAYIVASGSFPPGLPSDFFARVARIGRDMGSRVVVDTAGQPLQLAAKEGVFLLKPNLSELSQLAECELGREEEIRAAALKLIEMGHCEAAAVSLAAAGVLLVTADGCERIQAPAVRAVSKVGAGDSMVGGTVLALARGLALREAVRFGVAAGTAAVVREGTQLCTREETERLYNMVSCFSL